MAVVVPARDERERVLLCLRSVVAAVPAGLPTAIVLVADRCLDDTARLARGIRGVTVVEVGHGVVGAARRDGVRTALELLPGVPLDRVWIANTDADSVVPAAWLAHQRELADAGADLVIGTVRPDFAELPERFRDEWLADHRPGHPNGHVHGANLGFRASAYYSAGGYAADAEHEDVRLVERLLRAGARPRATDATEVLTSGRRMGRTPGGYAGYLRDRVAALPSSALAEGR